MNRTALLTHGPRAETPLSDAAASASGRPPQLPRPVVVVAGTVNLGGCGMSRKETVRVHRAVEVSRSASSPQKPSKNSERDDGGGSGSDSESEAILRGVCRGLRPSAAPTSGATPARTVNNGGESPYARLLSSTPIGVRRPSPTDADDCGSLSSVAHGGAAPRLSSVLASLASRPTEVWRPEVRARNGFVHATAHRPPSVPTTPLSPLCSLVGLSPRSIGSAHISGVPIGAGAQMSGVGVGIGATGGRTVGISTQQQLRGAQPLRRAATPTAPLVSLGRRPPSVDGSAGSLLRPGLVPSRMGTPGIGASRGERSNDANRFAGLRVNATFPSV